MSPQPKPQRRAPKAKKPLTRSKPMARSRMRPGKRKTKHARRVREWGRMAWLHSLERCAVAETYIEEWVGPCEGEFQVMHLGARKGYRAPDSQTALGCRRHHEDIDQARDWFRSETKDRRAAIERGIYEQATIEWEALTDAERAQWAERAQTQGDR